MSGNRTAPEFWSEAQTGELIRKTAQIVNGMMKGQQNNDFRATLRATPETMTEIAVEFARSGQVALLAPENASAATDYSLGTTYAVTGEGTITIHHAAGAADRQYGIILQG